MKDIFESQRTLPKQAQQALHAKPQGSTSRVGAAFAAGEAQPQSPEPEPMSAAISGGEPSGISQPHCVTTVHSPLKTTYPHLE